MHEESIGHMLSSCRVYTWGLYKERHDKVVFQIAKALAIWTKAELPECLRWGQAEWTGVGSFGCEDFMIDLDKV